MGPGRPKNQSSQNLFKKGVCVGLVNTNPMQLERDQMTPYAKDIMVYSFCQTGKILTDCTVCTVLMWQLTYRSYVRTSDVAV
jgi:hypothetical protein